MRCTLIHASSRAGQARGGRHAMRVLITLLVTLLCASTAGAATTVTFTTAGTNTWVAPAGVTSITVECWGGGGGGGSASLSAEGGGGGGAYAKVNTFAVTPGNSYSYTVGAGGAAQTAGGSSSFNATTCVAVGGSGTGSQTGATGGQASASTGDLKFNGGNGANGVNFGHGGGGGGSAGTGSNGNTATSGTGAAAVTGGGPGGNGPSSGNGSAPVSGPGGGGGGSISLGTASGGPGWAGQISITYTVAPPSGRKGQTIIGGLQDRRHGLVFRESTTAVVPNAAAMAPALAAEVARLSKVLYQPGSSASGLLNQ